MAFALQCKCFVKHQETQNHFKPKRDEPYQEINFKQTDEATSVTLDRKNNGGEA